MFSIEYSAWLCERRITSLTSSAFGVSATRGEHAVELARPQAAGLRKAHVERAEEIAQRIELLEGRLVVDAVDDRALLRLQRLGGGDVRLDHELLDQPVRVETRRHDDAVDRAVRRSGSPCAPAGRCASGSRRSRSRDERGIGRPERLQDRLEQRRRSCRRACRRSPPAPARRRALRPSASSRGGSCGRASCRRRRSACARRAPGAARLRAASRGRWRCAPAASARRGRGNRRSCRASPPRGRAPSRGARNRRRRRWRPSR